MSIALKDFISFYSFALLFNAVVYIFLCFQIYFCLIGTCNQIAIWYLQVVQYLVRGNSEPETVRSKAHPQGEIETRSESVVWLYCSQGIQALCTLGICWALETGIACQRKHLMFFLSVTPHLYFPSSVTIAVFCLKLTFRWTHFNSLYTSTVWEECYCNSSFCTCIPYLFRKKAPRCVCMTSQYERPASDQGPENGSALFCASVAVVVHIEK